jgi:hypothetical protein
MNCHYLDSFLEVIWAAKDFRMAHSLLEDNGHKADVRAWLAKSRMNLEIALARYVVERDMIVRP